MIKDGRLQEYRYDAKNQLIAVIDAETKKPLEEYAYDASGNILKKTIDGESTTYTYDAANQLVSSVAPDGRKIYYAYDAAGRMIKEGEKTYEYGWLDKVIRVSENDKELARFEYHNNNQIAKAIRESGIETFEWDSLALIERSGTKYINEPHLGGGNPILAINGGNTEAIFTNLLGTSLGFVKDEKYLGITKTSFGAESSDKSSFFTGKPYIENLGYAFLFRNYRADMGKWGMVDPVGYPNGWNNLAYCNNRILSYYDKYGLTGFWSDVGNFFGGVGDFLSDNTLTNTVSDYWNALEAGFTGTPSDSSWVRDNADYCFGRDSHGDETGIDYLLSDSNPVFKFLSDYVPNMHDTAVIHDEIVRELQRLGYDNPTSPETMVPAWIMALIKNLYNTGESILDALNNYVSGVWE